WRLIDVGSALVIRSTQRFFSTRLPLLVFHCASSSVDQNGVVEASNRNGLRWLTALSITIGSKRFFARVANPLRSRLCVSPRHHQPKFPEKIPGCQKRRPVICI